MSDLTDLEDLYHIEDAAFERYKRHKGACPKCSNAPDKADYCLVGKTLLEVWIKIYRRVSKLEDNMGRR